MARTIYVGDCACGSQIYDEVVEAITCPKCGTVFVWSKRQKQTMKMGGCGNCGTLLFTAEPVSLPTKNTSDTANV